MAIIDVVFWDPAPGVYAWKFPNSELNTKTQLIVSEGQEAFLFNSGQAVGPFGPGKHVLDTANYPILKTFVKAFTGGVSMFRAEIWFISKSFKLDIKWGTANPIQIEDPKYNIMMPVRAFGQYGLTVNDSGRFLMKLIGLIPAFSEKTLSSYFKGIVVTQSVDLIAKYLIQKSISVLQLSAYLSEISAAIENQLSLEVEKYGMRIVNFTVNSISTNEDDPAVKQLRKALATRAEMDIVGFNYQQMRSFDTLETAAGNSGNGNVMNAGMGLAMGVGMGMPMGNMVNNMANNMMNTAGQSQTKRCKFCNNEVAANADFCQSCGRSMHEDNGKICDKCGKMSPANSNFCLHCGDHFNCCPNCGTDNPEDAVVCIKCGNAMPVICPQCGQKISAEMKFCANCGCAAQKKCPNCQAEVGLNQKFCAQCGTKVD